MLCGSALVPAVFSDGPCLPIDGKLVDKHPACFDPGLYYYYSHPLLFPIIIYPLLFHPLLFLPTIIPPTIIPIIPAHYYSPIYLIIIIPCDIPYPHIELPWYPNWCFGAHDFHETQTLCYCFGNFVNPCSSVSRLVLFSLAVNYLSKGNKISNVLYFRQTF